MRASDTEARLSPDAEVKCTAQERGYRVLLLLAGHEIDGVAPSDLAKAIGTSQANVHRDLRVLQKLGLAEQFSDSSRWRLGPKLVQIALAYQTRIAAARRRLDETEQRYSRIPN